MPNSIRTPRQGTTANSRRIAQAVDNEEWQEFRVSLKGISTRAKLGALQLYWYDYSHQRYNDGHKPMGVDVKDCDDCIRIDNYLKALMRGGQIEPFLSLSYFVNVGKRDWPNTMTSRTVDGLRRTISVIRK